MMRAWKRIWQELIVFSSDDLSRIDGYDAAAGVSGTLHSIVTLAQKLL